MAHCDIRGKLYHIQSVGYGCEYPVYIRDRCGDVLRYEYHIDRGSCLHLLETVELRKPV